MINLYPWNPRENLKTADDAASCLDTILAYEGHWGGVYALSDIADAMGEKRVIPKAWRSEKSVSEAEKRGDVLDFSEFMDMARALGVRLYAGAAKTRRPPPSQNGKSSEGLVVRLNSALDRCDAWDAARALRDIAEARGVKHAVRDVLANETPDFAAFMDAARALGLRIHAAVVNRALYADPSERRGLEAAAKSS